VKNFAKLITFVLLLDLIIIGLLVGLPEPGFGMMTLFLLLETGEYLDEKEKTGKEFGRNSN